LQKFSLKIKVWKFAIKYLPAISPNGKINYKQFSSILNDVVSSNGNTLVKNEIYSNQFFLFVTLLNHLIKKKDFEIFKAEFPELPSLIGLILYFLKDDGDLGGKIFPSEYPPKSYHYDFSFFFGPKTRIFSQRFIIKKR
jgi:hypothetical protein